MEEQRLRIRQSLEESLGVEEASYLMDRPAGGWSDLVTNHTLDLKFDVLDARFDAIDTRFDALRHELVAEIDRRIRVQTWSVVSTILASAGLLGVLQRI